MFKLRSNTDVRFKLRSNTDVKFKLRSNSEGDMKVIVIVSGRIYLKVDEKQTCLVKRQFLIHSALCELSRLLFLMFLGVLIE